MSAIIIAVGHGTYTDPFTCSVSAEDGDDVSKVEDCLERIRVRQFPNTKMKTLKAWVDEILVVEGDQGITHTFGSDDGLGASL